MPTGQHRRKADPAYAKKVKEGGKKANIIHAASHQYHQKEEEPKAEEQLEKDLQQIN